MRLCILSADVAERSCIVHCSASALLNIGGGRLEVATDAAVLALDSGRQIALEELAAVSDVYWEEWESRKPN